VFSSERAVLHPRARAAARVCGHASVARNARRRHRRRILTAQWRVLSCPARDTRRSNGAWRSASATY
jgi:hypothetical protein